MRYALFFFIAISLPLQAQQKPLPKGKENNQWLEDFKNIGERTTQIEAIKAKLYNDTLFADLSTRILFDGPKDMEKRTCKIAFILYFGDDNFNLDLQGNPHLKRYLRDLNERNILSIETVDGGSRAAALFGTSGQCGGVLLKCNRSLRNKIKKLFPKRKL